MQHKGELIEKAIRESGYSITRLAKKLGKSRRWMYLAFENPDLSIELVLEIGAIIHYDFSEELKQLKKYKSSKSEQLVQEPQKGIKNNSNDDHWKNKYLNLLEKYNELLLQKSTTEVKPKKSKYKVPTKKK